MKRERYSYSEILDDVTRYFTKIQTHEYLKTGLFPIIDQGKEFIAGYTNSSIGIYNDYPIIIFGDHTRIFKYIDFSCYLGADGVKALKNIKPDKINSKYLYYCLRNSYIPDTGYNRHFKWVKELFFYIHDIQTQKEIVAILDKVTSLISMRKEQLEKLDILVKSKFIEMFGDPVLNPKGWEKKKGNKLFNFTNGRFLNSSHRTQSGVPVFGGNGIAWYTNEPFIFFPTIIIGRVGENCGNIHYSTESIWVTDNAIYISKFLHNIFNLIYLSYEMNLLNFRSKAEGGGQPKITQKILNDCDYRIPPLDLQNQFAEFVEQVEKNKENIKSSLNQLETLYNALMQEYFE